MNTLLVLDGLILNLFLRFKFLYLDFLSGSLLYFLSVFSASKCIGKTLARIMTNWDLIVRSRCLLTTLLLCLGQLKNLRQIVKAFFLLLRSKESNRLVFHQPSEYFSLHHLIVFALDLMPCLQAQGTMD